MGKEQRQETKTGTLLPQEPPLLKKRYQHDEFCKDNLRDLERARKFLKLMFKPEIIDLLDLDKMELASESFLDEELKKLYADVLYRIPVKSDKQKGVDKIVVFVLIELKTESDKWTVFQQAKYIIRIWDEEFRKAKDAPNFDQFRLPMVIPVIFHHGEQKFTASTELIDLVHVLKGLEPYTLNVRSLLFDVMTLDEKDLPEDLELVVVIMILQAVFRKDIAERLTAIYRKLQPRLHIPRYRRLWEDCFYYALGSAKNFSEQDGIDIVTEIRKTGETDMATKYLIDLFEEQGVARGKAEGEAKAILAFLRTRFGRLPKSTADAVRATTDLKVLDKLTKLAAKCETLDEFKKALK